MIMQKVDVSNAKNAFGHWNCLLSLQFVLSKTFQKLFTNTACFDFVLISSCYLSRAAAMVRTVLGNKAERKISRMEY